MFEINDIVLYNQTDICIVKEIREMPFPGEGRINFYVLRPMDDDSNANPTLYVPLNAGEERLHRMFSAEELKAMLAEGGKRIAWFDAPLIRKKEYSDILSRSRPQELIGLIRTLEEHRAARLRLGQKVSEADEKYLLSAQKRLFPLFRYILNVEWDDFLPLIAGSGKK